MRTYAWNGSTWIKRGDDLDGESIIDFFGSSVALSDDGKVLAAGGLQNDDGAANGGHVRVYNWPFTTALTEALQGSDISIFPNPTDGRVYLDPLPSFKPHTLEVFDQYGKKVSQYSFDQNLESIQLPDTPGMYYLRFSDNESESASISVVRN